MSNTSKIEFPGYNLLSVDEKKCFVAMENLDRDNIWMIAIRNVCKNPNVYRFRKLVAELKSQAADNGQIMKNILGQELMDYIIKL